MLESRPCGSKACLDHGPRSQRLRRSMSASVQWFHEYVVARSVISRAASIILVQNSKLSPCRL